MLVVISIIRLLFLRTVSFRDEIVRFSLDAEQEMQENGQGEKKDCDQCDRIRRIVAQDEGQNNSGEIIAQSSIFKANGSDRKCHCQYI